MFESNAHIAGPPAFDPLPIRASAIIVAAGSGRRMGGLAKPLLPLNGRPVIAYSLDAIQASALIDQIVLVGAPETQTAMEELRDSGVWPKLDRLVRGGERRQDSVEAGLAAVHPSSDVILVHDGARPFAPAALFDACVAAARTYGAAIAATPVIDTLKRAEGGTVQGTVDRTGLWAAQTPQAVQVRLLSDGFAFARCHGIEVTDEAMLMETIGQSIRIVPGGRFNLKITHPDDLPVAEAFARYLWEAP